MAGFLSSSKQRLQHSKLVGVPLTNSDLKPLAEIISTEKSIITATNKLAQDTVKASTALKDYGGLEGDDLEDVLGKISFLFDQLAKAQGRLAEHESTVRLHFKTLRTREENFIALKKSKESLASRIESAEKQLAKTSAEHKDRHTRESRLFELRQEMVGMENSVMNEEARLGDFKRDAVREGLSLKLGAMLELAEKQTVISEMAKLLLAELPTAKTTPGHARANYQGYTQTEEVMQEAQKCLAAVLFNPNPSLPLSPSAVSPRFHRSSSGPLDPSETQNFSSPVQEDNATISDPAQRSGKNDYYDGYSSVPASNDNTGTFVSHDQPPPRQRSPYLPQSVPQSPDQSNIQSQTSLAYTYQTDNRSSLAYMDETPDSEPAPVVLSRSLNRRSTPTVGQMSSDSSQPTVVSPTSPTLGPPQTYSAMDGVPRHGIRDDQNGAYQYEENAQWARNAAADSYVPQEQVSIPLPPAATPQQSTIPNLPIAPPHFSTVPDSVSHDGAEQPVIASPVLGSRPKLSEKSSKRGDIPAPLQTSKSYLSKSSGPKTPTSPEMMAMPPYMSTEETNKRLSMSLPVAPPRLADANLIYSGGSNRPTTPTSSHNKRGPVRQDSALGSRFGFDDPAYKAKEDPNNLSQNAYFPGVSSSNPNMKDNTAPPTGYTYHRPTDPPKITASAFRKTSSAGRDAAYPEGPISPAAAIREAYLQQQQDVPLSSMESVSQTELPPVAPLKIRNSRDDVTA